MRYMGIDLHKHHLTICIRGEQGDILLRRQVRTDWRDVDVFLEELRKQSEDQGDCAAVMEVCGFNGWLLKRLARWGFTQVYVITAPPRARNKTDRRDAAKLSELLWINRERIAAGQRLVEVKPVYQATDEEQYDRQLTRLRHRLGRERTRTKNAIQGILRRHNREHECPTKGMFTEAALKWLTKVNLPEMDRIELDMQLDRYALFQRQIRKADKLIHGRAWRNPVVSLLRTLPKIGEYTALALWAYIGPISRFPHARSLANYFGITPGCRNSGQTDRPGSITKAGHPFIRFLLAQMVLHALRNDPGLRSWYRRIKQRRGARIARVAVMRRLCEAIWHMLTKQEPYRLVGSLLEAKWAKTEQAA